MLVGATCMATGNIHAAEKINLSAHPMSLNQVSSLNKVEQNKQIQNQLKLGNDYSFIVKSSNVDSKGNTHKRFQQMYKGVPVWSQQAITHESKKRGTTRLTGQIMTKIEDDLKGNVLPKRSTSEILTIIKEKAQSKLGDLTNFSTEKADLIVYIDERFGKAHLAYHVEIMANEKTKGVVRHMFIVDANNDFVYKNWNALMHIDAIGPGGNAKTGRYDFGTDFPALDATDLGNGNCTLENANVRAVDLAHSTNTSINTPFEFVCPENTYQEINGAFSPINDAYYFGNVTFDMYSDWYDTSPLPFQLSLKVHYGNSFENAFWDGQAMTFGDGATTFYPLVDINVTVHEVSHGFTDFNSDLIYSNESGGMNEAFSDIAGEAAEFYWKGDVDWFVGADIFKNGDGLRYFEDPTLDNRSIGHYSDYFNGMDVHFSSGIFNRAYYLIANTDGWDPRMAFDIFVLANQSYWMPDSTFDSGGCGLMAAAFDLDYPWFDVYDALGEVGVECTSNSIDEDADGMSDIAELIYGFDPTNADDAAADFDADGISNRTEIANGFDPKDRDTDNDGLLDGDEYLIHATSVILSDTDDDGMDDGWEVTYGFNPLNNADADEDADEDGVNNSDEFSDGTDPTDPDSFEIPPINRSSVYDIEDGLTLPNSEMYPFADANFSPTTNQASTGNYSLGSEDIGNNQYVAIDWMVDVEAGDLAFDLKTSTEAGWDFFQVYVDFNLMYSLSGENDWQTISIPLTAGSHSVIFLYGKDGSVSSGDDTVWVDNITYEGLSFDQDSDGMVDGWEEFYGLDPLDAADANSDLDDDGLTNLEEYNADTSPTLSDTDEDGLTDFDEITIHLTNPQSADSDGDGIEDALEISLSLDPNDPVDGITDLDEDGINNQTEAKYGSLLDDATSSPALLEIYSEALNSALSSNWIDSYVETWLVEEDADGEIMLMAEPISNNTEARIDYVNVFESGTLTFTAKFDTEEDLDILQILVDGVVFTTLSGQGTQEVSIDLLRGERTISFVYSKNGGLTSTIDRVSISNFSFFAPDVDTDTDGLTNAEEVTLGTDPLLIDTDTDGLTDSEEVALGTNPLLADSDSDGLTDIAEIGLGTNPLQADSDGDGVSDKADLFPLDGSRWNESGGGSLFFLLSLLAVLLPARKRLLRSN